MIILLDDQDKTSILIAYTEENAEIKTKNGKSIEVDRYGISKESKGNFKTESETRNYSEYLKAFHVFILCRRQ